MKLSSPFPKGKKGELGIRWTALLSLVWMVGVIGAEPLREPSFTDKGEGKALVEDLLTRMPREDTQILGLLKIRPPDGSLLEIPTRMTVHLTPESWNDRYETQPAAGRPGEILVIKHRGKEPSEYLHATFQKGDEPPELQPIEGADLYKPLAGSDFFLADLGLEFLHWPSQKIVKKEMRKSRSCRVVESINPNPSTGPYSRVLSWLDFETGNLIRAEGYDANNRLLKEFSIQKIARSEGKAQLKEIEMLNEQTDSRTRLEFNYDIPDK